MNIRAFVTPTVLATALALPAAGSAALAARADRTIPAKTPTAGYHGAPQGTTAKNGASVIAARNAAQKAKSAQKPKAAVKSNAARVTPRRLLIFVPSSVTATAESGVGGAENCASYTGCTDEEFCIVWFLRCELVPPPVGTFDPQRLTAS